MHVLNKYRGWASDSDSGANATYYLHTSVWYYMLSPYRYWTDNRSSILQTNDIGSIGSGWVLYSDGGVQF